MHFNLASRRIKREKAAENLSSMVGEQPQEFFKDLVRDLELREWQRVGNDYEVILHDCPSKMNYRASGPFSCPG